MTITIKIISVTDKKHILISINIMMLKNSEILRGSTIVRSKKFIRFIS